VAAIMAVRSRAPLLVPSGKMAQTSRDIQAAVRKIDRYFHNRWRPRYWLIVVGSARTVIALSGTVLCKKYKKEAEKYSRDVWENIQNDINTAFRFLVLFLLLGDLLIFLLIWYFHDVLFHRIVDGSGHDSVSGPCIVALWIIMIGLLAYLVKHIIEEFR
jgi:hypothetical protein